MPNEDFFDHKKKKLMMYGRRSKTYFIQKYIAPVKEELSDDEKPEEENMEATPQKSPHVTEENEAGESDTEEHGQNKEEQQCDNPDGDEEQPFMNRFVIDVDNSIKSYFDVIILLLVGYSCVTSLYNVAFTQPTSTFIVAWDQAVEVMFYSDLVLNFFQAY